MLKAATLNENLMAINIKVPYLPPLHELFDGHRHPEIKALHGIKQNPVFHPEGQADRHTYFVYEAARPIAQRDFLSTTDTYILVLAAVCHDLGKATTTELKDGVWVSPGHDKAGEKPTRSYLTRLGVTAEHQERIVCLVVNHMCHTFLKENEIASKRVAARLLQRLAGKTTLDELQRLVEADKSGRPPLPKGVPSSFLRLRAVCEQVLEEQRLAALVPPPLVTGKDLLGLGYPPGPGIGRGLQLIAEWQQQGVVSTKEEALTRLQFPT